MRAALEIALVQHIINRLRGGELLDVVLLQEFLYILVLLQLIHLYLLVFDQLLDVLHAALIFVFDPLNHALRQGVHHGVFIQKFTLEGS